MVDGSPAASVPVTCIVALPGKLPLKKTELSNEEGLISFMFDIPGDAQNIQIIVNKAQIPTFTKTELRRTHKATTDKWKNDTFSLNYHRE